MILRYRSYLVKWLPVGFGVARQLADYSYIAKDGLMEWCNMLCGCTVALQAYKSATQGCFIVAQKPGTKKISKPHEYCT
jgi:hypothetical protein